MGREARMLEIWKRRSNSKRYRETSEGYGKGVQTWVQTGIVSICQWPFQDPKLEVPTIYKAYTRPM